MELAVLFGSFARETAHDGSDVDIAVVYRGSRPALRDESSLQGRLEAALGQDVDLVPVDQATSATRWRIARDGVVVVARDPASWVRLRIRFAIEHDDLSYTYARALALQQRRLAAGAST